VSEGGAAEFLQREGPLARRAGKIRGHRHLLIDQRECRLANDEMVARSQAERVAFVPAEKDRVASLRQSLHVQPAVMPNDFGMSAGNSLVPGGGPNASSPAKRLPGPWLKFPPPAVLWFRALSNKIGH
jgi:hypothetical protein